jgi:SAM-dependent methyltransferase
VELPSGTGDGHLALSKTSAFRKHLPRPVKRVARPLNRRLRDLLNKGLDGIDRLSRNREGITPPRRMWSMVGSGNFYEDGLEFFQYLIRFGRLKPSDHVLEIGCGIGKTALPLTKYLGSEGSYDGFDIVPLGVEWCRTRITRKYPNFKFRTVNIFNSAYNPRGRTQGT